MFQVSHEKEIDNIQFSIKCFGKILKFSIELLININLTLNLCKLKTKK